jgi:hypothetical protein
MRSLKSSATIPHLILFGEKHDGACQFWSQKLVTYFNDNWILDPHEKNGNYNILNAQCSLVSENIYPNIFSWYSNLKKNGV